MSDHRWEIHCVNDDMSGIMLDEFNHELLNLPLAFVEDSCGSRHIDINDNTPDCFQEDKYQRIQITEIIYGCPVQ